MKKQVYGVVSDGEKSRLQTREIELSAVEGVSPGGIFNAVGLGTSDVALVSFAPGFQCEFHNTPDPTWMLVMHGEMELELSDGVTQRITPGDLIHLSDGDGQGHRSKVIGDQEFLVATAGYGG